MADTSVLNQSNIENALQQMAQMFPQHAANIAQYKNEIIQNVLNNTKPDPSSPLAQLTVSPSYTPPPMPAGVTEDFAVSASSSTGITIGDITFTPCEVSIGVATVQAGLFVVGLVGLKTAYNTNMTRALLAEMGPAPLNGFYSMFQNYKSASGLVATTKALFTIAGSIYKAGGFKIILDAWEENVSWYDWVVTGLSVVAQLVIWFASDGVAFIAKVALVGLSGITCGVSIYDALNTCDSSSDGGSGGTASGLTFTPTGSYINSSSNIMVTLSAMCQNTNGQPVAAYVNLTGLLVNTGYENQDGSLVLEANTDNTTSFVPGGSYVTSSTDIKVTLSALCMDINGNNVNSSIDITSYPVTQTFSNINGTLTADQS